MQLFQRYGAIRTIVMSDTQVSLCIQSASDALRNAEEALTSALSELEALHEAGERSQYKESELDQARSHVDTAQRLLDDMSFG